MPIKRPTDRYSAPDDEDETEYDASANEDFDAPEYEAEDEAPAPRRKPAAKKKPAEKAAPVRRRKPEPEPEPDEDDEEFEDEDEDEAPKVGTSIQSGWGAGDKVKDETKGDDFADDFKFTDDEKLIKFIEAAPFASWAQHWIDNPPKAITAKKSHACLLSVGGKRCPLCDIGDKPRGRFAFTVAEIDGDGEVSDTLALYASPTLYEILKTKNADKRRGPLDKHFWSASKIGEGTQTKHNLDVVKAADLAEEWELDAGAIEDALEGLEPLTADMITITPLKELAEIAR